MSPELVSAPGTSTGSSCRRRLPGGALGRRGQGLQLRDSHAAGGAVRGAGGREGRGSGPGIRDPGAELVTGLCGEPGPASARGRPGLGGQDGGKAAVTASA